MVKWKAAFIGGFWLETLLTEVHRCRHFEQKVLLVILYRPSARYAGGELSKASLVLAKLAVYCTTQFLGYFILLHYVPCNWSSSWQNKNFNQLVKRLHWDVKGNPHLLSQFLLPPFATCVQAKYYTLPHNRMQRCTCIFFKWKACFCKFW